MINVQSRSCRRALSCAVVTLASLTAATIVRAENIGQIKQPIIAGLAVDVPTQRARGLVTISVTLPVGAAPGTPTTTGTCSGTLINRYWVLTADHCITSDGKRFGPGAPIAAFTISSAWSAATPNPTQVVRVGLSRSRDVALIFLGAGDFGPVRTQALSAYPVSDNSTILKYGRGVSAYAQAGPPPVPAVANGLYLQANMSVTDVEDGEYTVEVNGTGQQSAGGDSGGPDWIVAPGGRSLVAIAGVTSRGEAEYLDGMPRNWNWVTDVGDSTSSGIWDLRSEILEIVEPASVEFCKDYATRAVAAVTENGRLMCGGSGDRWSSSQAAHLSWCINNRLNSDPANEESRARAETLQSCLASRCDDYATLASAAAKDNIDFACEGEGPRWTANRDEHANWCLSIRGDSAALNAENDARNSALQICRNNLKLRRAAETPMAPLPGQEPLDPREADTGVTMGAAMFCVKYADEAVAAAADNIARQCGGSGPRWTSDRAAHLAWCEGLADQTPAQSESAARAQLLATCVSPSIKGSKIKRF